MNRKDKIKNINAIKEFIKKENIAKSFVNAFKDNTCRKDYLTKIYNNPIEYINDFAIKKVIDKTNNRRPHLNEFFNYAFYWRGTKEGFNYWDNLKVKWSKHLKKYYI